MLEEERRLEAGRLQPELDTNEGFLFLSYIPFLATLQMFGLLAGVLVGLPAKIGVIAATVGLLAVGCYGSLALETNFDYNEWIEEGTYLRNYLEDRAQHFPDGGQEFVKLLTV